MYQFVEVLGQIRAINMPMLRSILTIQTVRL